MRYKVLQMETPVFQSSARHIYGKERKDQLATKQVPVLEKNQNKQREMQERPQIESVLFC